MSAKSKKSAAKKKNEKLKKKQAAKIAHKAVIEKKAAADPSFKIKEDKKELAAQKKAEKREKKLLKKRELAKKKKQDLKPGKKSSQKKAPPEGKKDERRDKAGGKKSEAQAAPPKEGTPKEKKHQDTKQPAASEHGALLGAGSIVAPDEEPETGVSQEATATETAVEQASDTYDRANIQESLFDEEETTVIDEVLEEVRKTGPVPADIPKAMPDEGGTAVNENAGEEEETSQPLQTDAPEPMTAGQEPAIVESAQEEETAVIDETFESAEYAEPGQSDAPEVLPGEEEATVIEETFGTEEYTEPGQTDVLQPLPALEAEETDITTHIAAGETVEMPQTDVLQPLPPLDDEEVFYPSEADGHQQQTTVPEPQVPDFEPVVFPVFRQETAVEPDVTVPAPGTNTPPVRRQDEPHRWMTFAEEPDTHGPLDEVLPNSALKLPQIPAVPAEQKRSAMAEEKLPARTEPAKNLTKHNGGDIAAVPFDTLKYTSPQTAISQPPAQVPAPRAKHTKKAWETAARIGRHITLAPVTVMSLSRRLYSFFAYQLSKFKYISKKARLILLAACLLAVAAVGGGLLYSRLHYEIPAAAKPAYGGVNIRAADLRDIDEIPLEEQQRKADTVKAKGDKDVFEFFALTDIIISEPADNLPIVLGNLEKNDCTFIISLVDREGQLMARTLGLPPGKYLPYITLIDRKLPYGEYDHLKLVVSAYDSDTLAYLGSQYTDFRLVIGIEDEGSTATPGQ